MSPVILLACEAPELKSKDLSSTKKPNVLIVLTDDQGYGDFGFTGNPIVKTPVLDELSNRGTFFDRFYVASVCAPTRASLLTGRDALRTGVFFVTRNGEALPEDEHTIAEAFQANGYRTGAFGKWHNGTHFPEHPMGQGFDTFYGFASGHFTLYFDPVLERNGKKEKASGYIADVITDAAISFVSQSDDEPFFAYVALNTPHSPFELPQALFEKYKKEGLNDLDASVYGMVENIDKNFGRILSALDSNNLRDDTIIVFLSDNGPAFPKGITRYNAGLKGGKGSLDEGGLRVPLIVHWPDHIEGGHVKSTLTQHIDLFPTLASLADIEIRSENKIDGIDQSALWLGRNDKQMNDRMIFTNRNRNSKIGDKIYAPTHPGAVRTQRWAAISDIHGVWSLYDIEADPFQANNVSTIFPEELERLSSAYQQWFKRAKQEGSPSYRSISIGTGFTQLDTLHGHEALIYGPGIGYAYRSGWSNDWISNWTKPSARAVWPIKVTRRGSYEVTYSYRTAEHDPTSAIKLSVQDQSLETKLAPAKTGIIPGNRLFETGEAIERVWRKKTVGIVNLDVGETNLELMLSEELTGPEIKAVHLKFLESE